MPTEVSTEVERTAEGRDACPECGGRGWVIAEDGGAGAARACECRKKSAGPRFLEAAGIPERYRHCRLANFETSTPDRAIGDALLGAHRISKRYVDTFYLPEEDRYRDRGLLFFGPPGSGKTHLAAAVLSELVLRYHVRGRFVDFTALLHQIQSTYDPSSPESAHAVLRPVIAAEVLVLDELGAQKPTEWVMNTLYLIMNSRYTARRPTIFTTNFRLEPLPRPTVVTPDADHRDKVSDRAAAGAMSMRGGGSLVPVPDFSRFELLSSRLSPQLVSRLFEMTEVVGFPDRDYRREGPLKRDARRRGTRRSSEA